MLEQLIETGGALVSEGFISAVTLVLLGTTISLGFAVRSLYLSKDMQAKDHHDEMVEATELMTTLVEQLKGIKERQVQVISKLDTAAQNAAANREILVRIDATLERG